MKKRHRSGKHKRLKKLKLHYALFKFPDRRPYSNGLNVSRVLLRTTNTRHARLVTHIEDVQDPTAWVKDLPHKGDAIKGRRKAFRPAKMAFRALDGSRWLCSLTAL